MVRPQATMSFLRNTRYVNQEVPTTSTLESISRTHTGYVLKRYNTYRTVSNEALCILSGIAPIVIKIEAI
jgi:hypothetical protein